MKNTSVVPQLVAWCPECKIFCPADEIGDSCPMAEHDTRSGFRQMVKRRGYVCKGDAAWFDKATFQEHLKTCPGPGGECGL